eukprot:jgi/Mesen1/8655/ME000502S08012
MAAISMSFSTVATIFAAKAAAPKKSFLEGMIDSFKRDTGFSEVDPVLNKVEGKPSSQSKATRKPTAPKKPVGKK